MIYLVKIILTQFLLLLFFEAFLKKKSFFKINRLFLLTSLVTSLLIPFAFVPNLSIDFLSFDSLISTQHSILSSDVELSTIDNSFSFYTIIGFVTLCGVFISLFKSTIKIYKIKNLIKNSPSLSFKKYNLIYLSNSKEAFSFFNYIFIGSKVPDTSKEKIIEHELIHIKQGHTYDLILLELFSIAFWFNPLIYIYRNRLTMNHEFEVDYLMIDKFGKIDYYESLLNQIYGTTNLKILNYFACSNHLKNRIHRVQNKFKNNWEIVNYLLILPFLFLIIVLMSSLNYSKLKVPAHDLSGLQAAPFQYILNFQTDLENINPSNAKLSLKENQVQSVKKTNAVKDKLPIKDKKEQRQIQLTSKLTEEMNNKLTKSITEIMNKKLTPKLTKQLSKLK